MIEIFGKDNFRRAFFGLFAVSAVVCAIATRLHYTHKYPGNPFIWAAWLLCLIFLLATYFPEPREIKQWALSLWSQDKLFLRVFAFLALVFVVTHIWNFKTAPWNQNGLFDDAAWDIYFAKNHVFTHEPFQVAYPDGIAREVMFHYYITFFFFLFGYDLLTFNLSLLLLGMITFLFTSLLIHRLFNNYLVTIVSALVFNFLPLHFIQTFIGHRYAIAAPLIMASLYFLTTGFADRSPFRIALSSILAAFCVEGAIMGKQFIICLGLAMILYVIADYKHSVTREKTRYVVIFGLGLVAALIPLILFAYYNRIVYFGHESDLTANFLQAYKNRASGALKPYVNGLSEIFFAKFAGRRFSMQDYVLIPFHYYAFLIPGLVIALLKKRFEIILLAIVPVVGAFVSSAYDFRVLHAAPFWIILMAFSFHALTRLGAVSVLRRYAFHLGILIIAGFVVAAGLIPSIRYIYLKSKDPYSINLLGQREVAVARFLRDIIAGVAHPSVRRKPNEFKKLTGLPEPAYDAFACNESGFAITHLFLQDYNDRQIMSFCEQTPMMDTPGPNVFAINKRVLTNYNGSKDLMLIWESSAKSARTINAFSKLWYLGNSKMLMARHAGRSYSFYILTIPKWNVPRFKQELARLEF
jgi:dolichyl-phosphate-mannose-protein mannosyltransferase